MSRLLIPGIFAVALGATSPAFAQTATTQTTTSAQPQSDYDRVMSGVDASTAGVVGKQPGTPAAGAATTTTKTVNGPFPLANNTGIGINSGGYGGGYGAYGRTGAYGATAAMPAYTMPVMPTMPSTGTSTTTTTTSTDGTTTGQ